MMMIMTSGQTERWEIGRVDGRSCRRPRMHPPPRPARRCAGGGAGGAACRQPVVRSFVGPLAQSTSQLAAACERAAANPLSAGPLLRRGSPAGRKGLAAGLPPPRLADCIHGVGADAAPTHTDVK
eukprot:scaffold1946_cov397-Prasinococcus_capsulatus_cf.AAC.5